MHGTRRPAQLPSARFPASTGLTPAPRTRIRTCPGPGTGSGTSVSRSCAGPPNSLTTTARMMSSRDTSRSSTSRNARHEHSSGGWHHKAMTNERIEVQRMIAADPSAIFGVLCDPQGHVAIDSAGMLMDATGSPVSAAGDSFVVHMDREALNDYPLGRYDVTVTITTLVPDREIARTVRGRIRPQVGHVYGYR